MYIAGLLSLGSTCKNGRSIRKTMSPPDQYGDCPGKRFIWSACVRAFAGFGISKGFKNGKSSIGGVWYHILQCSSDFSWGQYWFCGVFYICRLKVVLISQLSLLKIISERGKKYSLNLPVISGAIEVNVRFLLNQIKIYGPSKSI